MNILKAKIFFSTIALASTLASGGASFAGGTVSKTITAGIVIGVPDQSPKSSYSPNARFTCGAAKTKIRIAGYSEIRELDCVGNIYSFTAWIDAHRTEVGFNSVTGQILYF